MNILSLEKQALLSLYEKIQSIDELIVNLSIFLPEQTDNGLIAYLNSLGRQESWAFWLARNVRGVNLLAAENHRLSRLINNETLNELSPTTGLSVAFFLAFIPDGLALLSANNHRLAQLINASSLNQIIQSGPGQGYSLAFLLAKTHEGLDLLSANNHRLAQLIDASSLNQIIQRGPKQGLSLAFCWPSSLVALLYYLLTIIGSRN